MNQQPAPRLAGTLACCHLAFRPSSVQQTANQPHRRRSAEPQHQRGWETYTKTAAAAVGAPRAGSETADRTPISHCPRLTLSSPISTPTLVIPLSLRVPQGKVVSYSHAARQDPKGEPAARHQQAAPPGRWTGSKRFERGAVGVVRPGRLMWLQEPRPRERQNGADMRLQHMRH